MLHREFEGEVFVYNPHTGHTHILNQFSWSMLSACVESPRSVDQLLTLAQTYSDEVDREQLAVHVDHLLQLELLRSDGFDQCA